MVAPDMVVLFKSGEAHLCNDEAEALKNWVRDWPDHPQVSSVSLGGACETSRAGILRRLNCLLDLLGQLGVPSKNIRQDGDWTRPSRMGSMDDLPMDVVWLQLNQVQSHKKPALVAVCGSASEMFQRKDKQCTREL
ncbi:MAG: hypothetical protein D4R79_07630 [Comamonadaceae bacterium]|nr:MAG: hypothetical protein D4R79_07630 [Comamonadaceae bacterium]